MARLFLFIFLVIATSSSGQQKINVDDIYSEAIESYLTFVNETRNTKFDTLYIQSSDSVDYHLVQKINNTTIKVLPWPDLADKIDQAQAFFYIKLMPAVLTERKVVVGIFGHQVEIEDGEKIVGAQRRFEQVSFTTNKRRTKCKLQEIKTDYGYCTTYFLFEKVTKKLIQTRKTCI